jgi:hypothetical protein
MPLSPGPCFVRLILCTGLLLASLALGGCAGMFHTAATVGPDLQPHLTTAVSIPFGK